VTQSGYTSRRRTSGQPVVGYCSDMWHTNTQHLSWFTRLVRICKKGSFEARVKKVKERRMDNYNDDTDDELPVECGMKWKWKKLSVERLTKTACTLHQLQNVSPFTDHKKTICFMSDNWLCSIYLPAHMLRDAHATCQLHCQWCCGHWSVPGPLCLVPADDVKDIWSTKK